ncbi:MAG TPA: acyl-CoA dehydrogenase family protein [Acidimicrobiia bacterium]|nr:acyl-CoA dehydrogenase family protein [Acidimicrobiia bacterium]
MDLGYTKEDEAFRAEAREWLAAHVAPYRAVSSNTRDGFARLREWDRLLFNAGWSVVSWPREYGGREASLWQWLIFEEEYWAAGAPQRNSQNGISLLAPTLFEFGTDEQRDRILPKMASGEEVWAQGWSEPNAGSDLAGIQSRAERATDDGQDGWRLTGQKTWCSRGAFCDRLFGLFRSDPAAERHRGLTYLMADLHADGVDVRPVRVLDGEEGFAEVFFDGAFVSDADVIGEAHQGWSVAMATASSERGLTLRSPGRFLATAERLLDLWRELGDRSDPVLADQVTGAWMDAQAYQLFTQWAVTGIVSGPDRRMGAEASLNKVWWSDLDISLHEAALALLGDEASLETDWMRGYEFALAGPIYAGTNEIQRNVIAQRLLGLPRT